MFKRSYETIHKKIKSYETSIKKKKKREEEEEAAAMRPLSLPLFFFFLQEKEKKNIFPIINFINFL